MNLTALDQNAMAIVTGLGDKEQESRLRSAGIRVGAGVEVLGRTSARGYLIKVDDTRLVLSQELAQTIDCRCR